MISVRRRRRWRQEWHRAIVLDVSICAHNNGDDAEDAIEHILTWHARLSISTEARKFIGLSMGARGDRVCTQIKSSLSDWNMVCNIRVEYLILDAGEYKSDAEKGKNSLERTKKMFRRPCSSPATDCSQKVRRTEKKKKTFFIRNIFRNAQQRERKCESFAFFMFAVERHGRRLRTHLRGEQRKVPTSK